MDLLKTHVYSKSGEYAPIVEFECRGVKPIEYDVRAGWTATHPKSGKVFSVDLSDDFADYDDDEGEPVGVYRFEYQFR